MKNANTPINRQSCRTLLLTPDKEILLIKIDNPEGGWSGWITPGGGRNENESEESTLHRELHEELGISDCVIGSLVWIRKHTFQWHGQIIAQHEKFYLINVKKFNPKPSPNAIDFHDLKAFHWWKIEELQHSDNRFAPEKLYHHLMDLINNGVPPLPVDVGV